MKKMSLLILGLSFLVFSCESTDSSTTIKDDSSVQQVQAAAGLKVITDGMKNLDPSIIKNAGDGTRADIGEIEIYNEKGMVITMKLALNAKGEIGVQLHFTLTNYESKTTIINLDGSKTEDVTYVTGELTALAGYNIILQQVVIVVNSMSDKELVFKGGSMNGTKLGFNNLEMTFSTSQVTIGSPVAVKGTITVNGLPIIIDSEIIELLMGLMGM